MNSPTPHNHDSGDDLEDRLRRRLRSTPIDLPSAPGPSAAADRAHQRSRRRRSGLVAAAVALVAGLAAPTLLGDDPDEGVDTDIAAPIDANGVELDWQVNEDGLSMINSSDEGADGFYALSTAPGTRMQDFPQGNAPRALYRWSDGAWQPIVLGDDDPNVAKVSERDGALYALSTAAETGGPIGSVSTDGGDTWTQVPLGTVEPPSTTVDWTLNVGLELASTADTTVGVVSTRFHPPVGDLFPELSQEPENCCGYSWRYSDAGVELIEYTDRAGDPEASGTTSPPSTAANNEAEQEFAEDEARDVQESVVRTVPWSELGVADASALGRVTTYQVDGEAWTPMADGPATGIASGSLVSTDSGILIHTYSAGDDPGAPQSQVFHTTDGAAWQPVPTPVDETTEWGQTVLAPNGHLLHYNAGPRGPGADFTVSVSTDLGGSWAPIDMLSIAPELDENDDVFLSASSGPLGVAVMAHGFNEDESPSSQVLLFSTDLRSWSTSDIAALATEDAPHMSGLVMVGTDHIVIPMTGGSSPDDDEPGPSATLVATPVR